VATLCGNLKMVKGISFQEAWVVEPTLDQIE